VEISDPVCLPHTCFWGYVHSPAFPYDDTQTGVMPLHTASFNGHLAIVEELLSHYHSANLIDMATEVSMHILKCTQ